MKIKPVRLIVVTTIIGFFIWRQWISIETGKFWTSALALLALETTFVLTDFGLYLTTGLFKPMPFWIFFLLFALGFGPVSLWLACYFLPGISFERGIPDLISAGALINFALCDLPFRDMKNFYFHSAKK